MANAARLYSRWLKNNASSPQAATVFFSYLRVEQNLQSVLEVSRMFISASGAGTGNADAVLRSAQLFELIGSLEEARSAYREAYRRGASIECLRRSLQLSLEMGDTAAMEDDLLELKEKGVTDTSLMEAVAENKKGNRDSARSILRQASDSAGDADSALKALWELYVMAMQGGDESEKEDTARRLGARFQKSPEYSIASSPAKGTAVLAPAPDWFFSCGASDSSSDSSSTATSPSDSSKTAVRMSVQAGSFQMRENADDLVAVLSRDGFTPTICEQTVQGKKLYKVFAGTSLEPDQASAVLGRLREAGFTGFLVNEK